MTTIAADAKNEAGLSTVTGTMGKFKIRLARIEAGTGGRVKSQVSITFEISRETVSFEVPIRLNVEDYDDTEMVEVARSVLHRTFIELAAQSRHWKLSTKELRLLSGLNTRAR